MAKMKGTVSEYPLVRSVNIVELNLSETMIDDRLLAYITEVTPKLGILNLSGCQNLTDSGIERATFPSLWFLGLAHCNVGVLSIICSIRDHEIFAMCVDMVATAIGV